MFELRNVLLVSLGIVIGSVTTILIFQFREDEKADPERISDRDSAAEPDVSTIARDEAAPFKRDIRGDGVLRGLVKTVDGTAIKSAKVRIHLTDQPWSHPDPPVQAITDAKGQFAFKNLDTNLSYQVWAMTDWSAVSSKKKVTCETPVELVLDKGASIKLKLNGLPNPPAPIRIQIAGTDLWPIREHNTTRDGSLTISGLKDGEYVLWIESGNLAHITQHPILITDGKDVDLRLDMAVAQPGRVAVTDEAGQPLTENTYITLKPSITGLLRKTVLADSQGNATINGLVPGTYTVTASSAGYAAPAMASLRPGDNLRIQLVPGATARGVVRTLGGEPISGANLAVEQGLGTAVVSLPIGSGRNFQSRVTRAAASGWPRMVEIDSDVVVPGPSRMPVPKWEQIGDEKEGSVSWQPTGPNGTFVLDGLPSGRLLATATHPEYVAKNHVRFTLEPGGQLNNLAIIMQPGTTCTARTVDERGFPLADTEVRIYHPDGHLLQSRFTESDGYVTLRGLPGSFQIEATGEERIPAVKTFAGRTGRSVEIELRLPPADQTLYGRVLNPDGFGVTHVTITARSVSKEHAHVLTGITDDDGTFSLQGAGKKRYHITASHPEHGMAQVAAAGHEQTVKLVLGTRSSKDLAASENQGNYGFGPADSLGQLPKGEGVLRDPATPNTDLAEAPDSVQTQYGQVDQLAVTGPPPGKGGLPIKLTGKGGKVIVSSVSFGSQVAEAGLKSGDRILAIDGKKVTHLAAAKKAISGRIGTIVMLKVTGPEGPYTIVVQRVHIRAQ